MIDIFDTRNLMAIVKYIFPVVTPFKSMFFSNEKISNTKFIDIDFVRGSRKLAPYVGPKMQSKTVDKRGFETRTVTPPYIKLKDVTTAEDILKRQVGRNIYQNNVSPAARARQMIAEQSSDFIDMIMRKIEFEAHRVLTTLGDVTFTGEGLNITINFNMKASHKITLAGTDKWDDAGSDPSKDIRDWAILIKKDAGLIPDMLILDNDATQLYINHAKVKDNLDTRRADMGFITPGAFGSGLQFIGHDRFASVDIWSYTEFYETDGGTVTPIMTTKTAVLGSTKAQTIMHFGAIEDVQVGTASTKFFPKSWIEEDPSARLLSIQSAPLPAPHQIDGFVSVTVA